MKKLRRIIILLLCINCIFLLHPLVSYSTKSNNQNNIVLQDKKIADNTEEENKKEKRTMGTYITVGLFFGGFLIFSLFLINAKDDSDN